MPALLERQTEPRRQESGEAKAEPLVREELARQGWTEADLGRRRKGDPGKVRIARRLRAETTMTLAWIAQRLRMGGWDACVEPAGVQAKKRDGNWEAENLCQ